MAYDHVNPRNPHKAVERPSVDTMAGDSNVYDGVFAGETRTITDVNLAAIPPNGKRPNENKPTKHLFGTWSD